MPHQFSTLTYTPSVKEVQREMGSRKAGEMMTERGPANDRLGPDERYFISLRDGFYMATVSETGWPYIQFRGGPAGFLHVIDEHTIAFADVTGNRQYISTGNLRANNRVALFLMDYPTQSRLKILGEAEILPWKDAGELQTVLPLPPKSKPERVVRIHVDAFDWNCPQHIPQRFTLEELQHTDFGHHIQQLEEENRKLRAALAAKNNLVP
jgi:predicted pyridoxine 5'-phosphate oxidase superfamily flavin-nucleotide-binding protein